MHSSALTPFYLRGRRLKCLVRLLVFTIIFALALPAVADAFLDTIKDALKITRIIAVSESGMTWDEAISFCQQKGGRLPLVGGENHTCKHFPSGTAIDGLGTIGGRWPANLPSDPYWTATHCGGNKEYSWFITDNGGNIAANYYTKNGSYGRVVCVP